MPHLNEDVLLQIVRFISQETLDRINSCNSVFFKEWMKSRYDTVILDKRDEEMKRLLAHLSEPNVAVHVKRLIIRPWLVQPRTKSPRSLTENLIVRFLEVFDPHYTKKKAEQRLQKRLHKDINNVSAAFGQMKGLTEYTIEWDDTQGYHPEFYKAFLTRALENWSLQLVKLTVKVPPSMLSSLAHIHLPKLEVFVFHFNTGSLSFKDIDNLHEGLVVFVNNLKESLRSLSLFSSNTSKELDISRIFRKLGIFPSLRKIALSIPFDGAHLPDPMTFVRFLEKHRLTIKEIDILSSRCTPRSSPGDPECINWVQRIFGSLQAPFPQLRAVGVALRPLRAPLDVLIHFLAMHSSTLDSLKLADRCLDVGLLRQMFWSPNSGQIVASDITELQVKMTQFSAGFLAELALLFPRLKTLKVECTEDPSRPREVNVRKQGISEFSANLSENRGVFAGWELQHLAIGPSEYRWARVIEQDLHRYIPNLTVSDFDL